MESNATQARDLLSIYTKLVQVLYPRRGGAGREVLKYVASNRSSWSCSHFAHPETGIYGVPSFFALRLHSC
jgi:hypothetical protein